MPQDTTNVPGIAASRLVSEFILAESANREHKLVMSTPYGINKRFTYVWGCTKGFHRLSSGTTGHFDGRFTMMKAQPCKHSCQEQSHVRTFLRFTCKDFSVHSRFCDICVAEIMGYPPPQAPRACYLDEAAPQAPRACFFGKRLRKRFARAAAILPAGLPFWVLLRAQESHAMQGA